MPEWLRLALVIAGKDVRAELRSRMPGQLDQVVKEILQGRILHLVRAGRPVRTETMSFWNQLAEGEPWASASEV